MRGVKREHIWMAAGLAVAGVLVFQGYAVLGTVPVPSPARTSHAEAPSHGGDDVGTRSEAVSEAADPNEPLLTGKGEFVGRLSDIRRAGSELHVTLDARRIVSATDVEGVAPAIRTSRDADGHLLDESHPLNGTAVLGAAFDAQYRSQNGSRETQDPEVFAAWWQTTPGASSSYWHLWMEGPRVQRLEQLD